MYMTFAEIFDNFKNHSYIRRKSWPKHVFAQYRNTVPLIRLVWFTDGIEGSCKPAIDTLSNDFFSFVEEYPLGRNSLNVSSKTLKLNSF